MDLAPAQLAALVAIADHGTFEAAARHLHVTPSAVSQRIRALESEVGQVVVQRTTPCRPTAAGEVLLRLARQTRLLHDEVRDALAHGARRHGRPAGRGQRRLAGDLVPRRARRRRRLVRRRAAAARRGPGLLGRPAAQRRRARRGDLRAGRRAGLLGRAARRAALRAGRDARSSPSAGGAAAASDWAAMPVVVFNEKDALQHDVLAARGVGEPPVVHRVPTSADFLEAVCSASAGAMVPEPQLAERAAGAASAARLHVDVAAALAALAARLAGPGPAHRAYAGQRGPAASLTATSLTALGARRGAPRRSVAFWSLLVHHQREHDRERPPTIEAGSSRASRWRRCPAIASGSVDHCR